MGPDGILLFWFVVQKREKSKNISARKVRTCAIFINLFVWILKLHMHNIWMHIYSILFML